MSRQQVLLIPMFLLIFGPKTSGWIDVVSITSILLVGAHFFCINTSHLPQGAKRRALILAAAFLWLLGYATVHYLLQVNHNAHQVLRFGRVLVNFLGVLALVSFYVRLLGPMAGQVLMRHLFHCLVIHALIMAGMFVSPVFRELIVNRIVQADPDSRTYLAKATGYRIAGLTDSWDALSGLQSLGLLMLPILLTHGNGLPYSYTILATPLLLFSVAISGRTGFVTLAILGPLAMRYTDFRKVHRTTLVALAVAMVGVLLVMGPWQSAYLRALEDTSLGRTLAIFGLDYTAAQQSRERITDTFSGILTEHYFLPENLQTLALGTGGSGRDNWDYVPADNGLILNLHNLGIGCFLVIYGTLAWMMVAGIRIGRMHPEVAGICLLAVLLVVLIDVKVMYAYSRNGFTAMLIPVLTAWWELARTDGSRSFSGIGKVRGDVSWT
jgi:hypothetical protein